MKRIGLHTFNFCGADAMVSTVQVSANEFETMALYADGDEIESKTTNSLAEARKAHNAMMTKYNDMLYNDSLQKALGLPNLGQFVHTVVAC